jgi:hypothetical protein
VKMQIASLYLGRGIRLDLEYSEWPIGMHHIITLAKQANLMHPESEAMGVSGML